MKFRITGADRTSGAERVVIIDSDDEQSALLSSKQQGVFPYKVEFVQSDAVTNETIRFAPTSSLGNTAINDPQTQKRLNNQKEPPKRKRLSPYTLIAICLLGLIGMVGVMIDPETGSTRQRSNSSDKRNAELLIAGIAALGGNNAVESVAVSGNSATITVANAWHFSPYQVRLQAAQNLQVLWFRIAPTENSDDARISLVDLNGNEVGGSRVFGGSLVWVQQN